jgi:GNAT superfamily N-acetyltransferase
MPRIERQAQARVPSAGPRCRAGLRSPGPGAAPRAAGLPPAARNRAPPPPGAKSPRDHAGQVDGYVGELVAAKGSERRGIGDRLMAAAEARAAGRGRAFLTLETGPASQQARSSCASLGYQEEDPAHEIRATGRAWWCPSPR